MRQRLVGCSILLLAGCGAPEVDSGGGEDSVSEASLHCAGTTVEGVDVSDNQGAVDWSRVRAAGIRFAVAKATQGTYNTQGTFAANWSHMKSAGLIRGAYHFFDPREDGVAQANHFLAVVGALHAGDLPPMLDIECPDGDPKCLGFSGGSGAASGSAIRQRMIDFLNTVHARTGRKPLIYTFGSYFSGNGVSTSGLQSYPLNIAYPTTGNCFNVPSPWSAATIWQYSWTGVVPGIATHVDRDHFLGTLAELEALAGEASAPCNSSTLAKSVPTGTCVQAASDEKWYHCADGAWDAGETGCTKTYAWCHSNTLGKDVPARTCVQSKFDRVWYQCDAQGWVTPVADGAGPLGTCSVMHAL